MSERIQRINQLLKKELSQTILDELDFDPDTLVTLTRVETAMDLGDANVFVSVMPEDKMRQVVKILNNNLWKMQKILNKRLRMKIVPKIRFVEEKQTREAARIEEILAEIKKEQDN